MAKSDSNVGLGVKIVATGAIWTRYEGSREALIAEGICAAERFPEAPKRAKFSMEGRAPNGPCWTVRRIRGGQYEVTYHHGRLEQCPGRGAHYESLEAWRAFAEKQAELFLSCVEAVASGEIEQRSHGSVTVRFNDASLAQIRAALGAVQNAVFGGTIVWEVATAKVRRALPAAKADAPLQRFLTSVVSTGGRVSDGK